MTAVWHWVVHQMGVDYGAPYGHWIWYNFWSGIAGSFLVAIVVWFFGFYAHHTCHTWWCPRRAMFDFSDPATGLKYKLCRICHPVHTGQRLTRGRIRGMYLGNQRGPG